MNLVLLMWLGKRFGRMIFHLRLCASSCSHRSSNWLLDFLLRASVYFWDNSLVTWAKFVRNGALEKRFISCCNHAADISPMLDLLSLQTVTPLLKVAVLLVKGKGRIEFWCAIVEIRRVSKSVIESSIHLRLAQDVVMLQEDLMGIHNVGVVKIAGTRNLRRLLVRCDHIVINGSSIPLICLS